MRQQQAEQLEFTFRQWGGPRKGAGRKPKPKGEAGVPHQTRATLASRYPVHVTVRLKKGLPTMRSRVAKGVLLGAFRKGKERFGFRLVHYAIMSNHLHLIVEARDRRALSRGMQGLLIRVARGLNKQWGRAGKLFDDRYHDHILKSPREVRHALVYVLRGGHHPSTFLPLPVFPSSARPRGPSAPRPILPRLPRHRVS